MKTLFPSLLLGLALASVGCTADVGEGTGASTVLETSDCVVEGFGTLPAGDEFDGMAMGSGDGFAEGTWVHLGPETVVGGGGGSGRDDDDDIDEGIDEDRGGPRDWGDEDDDLPGEGCRGERRGHREGRGEGHDRHEGRGRGHHCGCDDDDHDDDGDDDEPPVISRDRFEGVAEGIFCSINGSRIGTVTGSGTWNGDSGYTFEVFVNDGGPTNDEYTFTVYDSGGTVVYSVNGFPDTGDLTVAAF